MMDGAHNAHDSNKKWDLCFMWRSYYKVY